MRALPTVPNIISAAYLNLKKDAFWGFLLLLLCFALYAPALSFAPIGDDIILLSAASSVKSPLTFLVSDWGYGRTIPYFRPLHSWFLWAGYHLFGVTAWPNQLVSILLHSLNAFLIFRFISNYQLNRKLAFLFSAFFALSLYTFTTATWVSARTGLAVGVFLLLLLQHLHPWQDERPLLNLWYVGTLIILAMMSKESGLLVPAFAFLASVDIKHFRNSNFRLMALSVGLVLFYLLYRQLIFGVVAVDTVYETRPIMLLGGQDLSEIPPSLADRVIGFGEIIVKNIVALALPVFNNQGLFARPLDLASKVILWVLTPLIIFLSASKRLNRLQWYGLLIIILNGLMHFSYFAFFLLYIGQIGLTLFLGASRLNEWKKTGLTVALCVIVLFSALSIGRNLSSALIHNRQELAAYQDLLPSGVNLSLAASIFERYGISP